LKGSFFQKLQGHLPGLLRRGVRITGTRADAEDLAQDTVVRALEKQAELRSPDGMGGWLKSIQRTVHLNGRRNLSVKLEVLEGGVSEAKEPSRDLREEVDREVLDGPLARALESLPPEWRDVLWMREVEELSYEEIARAQGCPVGTVRSRLARARQGMMKALGEERRHGQL
jgi:RNA polymerase sigma-70 factor (ECF subfamily)